VLAGAAQPSRRGADPGAPLVAHQCQPGNASSSRAWSGSRVPARCRPR
jgi:hypothetical protein